MMRIAAVVSRLVAASVLGISLATATAAASGLHPCTSYIVNYQRTFSGQHWTYRIRIEHIHATGISCRDSRHLIQRFDNDPRTHDVGQYISEGRWRCENLRPFAGGPGGHFLVNEDCKRPGGGRLIWQEEQLNAKRTG
jgi:hypothetical protein